MHFPAVALDISQRNAEKVYLYPRDTDVRDRDSSDDECSTAYDREVDGLETCENYVQAVVEEDLQILDLPADEYVRVVWGCRPNGKGIYPYYAVALFDNYNIDQRPSAEIEERIRTALGLEGKPGWFPEVMSGFHWYYWDSD